MLPGISTMIIKRLTKRTAISSYVRHLTDDSGIGERQVYEKSINRVELLGRAGNDPQSRGSEKYPVVTFSLATNTYIKNIDGETEQRTQWHRISIFKPMLKDSVYNNLRKGQRVYVTGRLGYNEVTDPSNNQKTTLTSIIADDVIFFAS